jgi:tetratricopeptide (TPR) repeat protein
MCPPLVQSFVMASRRLSFSLLILLCGAVPAAAAGARERCLAETPIDFDLRISACTTFLEAGQVAEEERGPALANRGNAYLDKQVFGLALDDFEHAVELLPDDANTLRGRCRTRAVLKRDLDGALADCNRALELQPDARTLGYRAFVYLRLELFETAIADYSAALDAAPKTAEYLYGRGQARFRSGDAEGGKTDIAAARAINPKIADEFARLEHDESSWSWAALLEYWRTVMKWIY